MEGRQGQEVMEGQGGVQALGTGPENSTLEGRQEQVGVVAGVQVTGPMSGPPGGVQGQNRNMIKRNED